MMETKNRIEIAKVNLRKAENAKVQAETQLEAARKQQEEVVQKMEAAGVTPDTITEEIKKLEGQVEEGLNKVEQLIPRV
ncbi:hypothetical protein HWB91_gp34 [Bacillus phage vB_BboS-125]|uniref:Uncharacterized protein n=1 Tax=Bacillus phage vB_BboS-125 TaxID=2419618 RepID=A0A3G3BVX9_9CAUD|nr:hypothetical protein HWB91_gp34 [Bacillus phage vB_BboS-125]AYP68404.1 hypothetical protein BboS125_00034 [Bacillus phage vB_BboS-125]